MNVQICEQLLDLRLLIKDPKLILKEIKIFKGFFSKEMFHCLTFKLHSILVLLNERKGRLLVEMMGQVAPGQFLVLDQLSRTQVTQFPYALKFTIRR